MMDSVVPRAFAASVPQPEPDSVCSEHQGANNPARSRAGEPGEAEQLSQARSGSPLWIQVEQAAGKLGAGGQNWGAGTAEGCVTFLK